MTPKIPPPDTPQKTNKTITHDQFKIFTESYRSRYFNKRSRGKKKNTPENTFFIVIIFGHS